VCSGPEELHNWAALYGNTDSLVFQWLSHGRRLLERLSEMARVDGIEIRMVLVTMGELIPTLVKLLLFRLGEFFSPEHIYCGRHIGKAECFKHIAQQFGPAAKLVAIGDGEEEEDAARRMAWPFIRITLSNYEQSAAPENCVRRGSNGFLALQEADSTGRKGCSLMALTAEEILALF